MFLNNNRFSNSNKSNNNISISGVPSLNHIEMIYPKSNPMKHLPIHIYPNFAQAIRSLELWFINDEVLENCGLCVNLQSLSLTNGGAVTATGLTHLPKLKHSLVKLCLFSFDEFSTFACSQLAMLCNLKILKIYGWSVESVLISQDGFRNIVKSLHKLQELEIGFCESLSDSVIADSILEKEDVSDFTRLRFVHCKNISRFCIDQLKIHVRHLSVTI